MKKLTVVLITLFLTAGNAMPQQIPVRNDLESALRVTDPWIGIWKFNPEKSKNISALAENISESRVIFRETDPNAVEITSTNVLKNGSIEVVWQCIVPKIGGIQQYQQGGPGIGIEIVNTMIDDHTQFLTYLLDGMQIRTGTLELSEDGKTYTLSMRYPGAIGGQYATVSVFEKQAGEIELKLLAALDNARMHGAIPKPQTNNRSYPPIAGMMRSAANPASTLVGQDAIDFSLKDLSGNTVNLSDFRGKAVLLDFWATWCGPCREAIPHLEALHKKYKDKGLVVIGINKESDHAVVEKYAEVNISYVVLLDAAQQFEQYSVQGIPSKFYIDAKGKIRHVALGFTPGKENDIEQKVQALLAEIEIQ